MKTFLLAGCAFACLTSALSASAQEAPTPQASPSAQAREDNAIGLSEIVVTAQRRSENLQRAAVAVSAVGADTLERVGVTKPSDLSGMVPALQVTSSGSSNGLFYVRGVGNFTGNSFQGPAVAFNVDGVYIARASSIAGFFYDLERVEVLKGPQGTLYGRNATGGAINVISHKPEIGGQGGRATIDVGNHDAIKFDGAVNLPVSDKTAVRAAVTYAKHDGYNDDGTDDENALGGRIALLAKPNDDVSLHVVVDYFRQRGAGTGGTPLQLGIEDRPGFLSPAGQAFTAAQPNTLFGRTSFPLTYQPYVHNNYWGVAATLDWVLPAGTLTVVPAYRGAELDYMSDSSGFYVGAREKDKQSSLEVRWASGDDQPLRYILGAYYFDETNDVPFFYVNQQSNLNINNYKLGAKSTAAFGRLTYAVTDDFRLNVGARYTEESKEFSGVLNGWARPCIRPSTYGATYVPGCPAAVAFPVDGQPAVADTNPLPDFTLTVPSIIDATGANARHAKFDKVTYRVGADWDITSANFVYASYETGFKSGGFFFSSDSGVYRPEAITALTLGSKNRFADNRLQLNLEAYHWRYRDQQITHVTTDSTGHIILGTENVGRATIQGMELESRFLATENTELQLDVQYLKSRYDQFVYQIPNSNNGAGNGTGCPTVGTPGASYTVDCSGKTPPYAPKWTINMGVQQKIPLSAEGEVTLGANAHYQSRSLAGLEFLPIQQQAGFWTVDLRAAYTAPNERYTLTGYVNNLFDETILGATFPVPFTFYTSASLRPPRTFGIRLNVKY